MLIKGEEILRKSDIAIYHFSKDDLLLYVRRQLASKIIDECIAKELIKYEIFEGQQDGCIEPIIKIKASLQAYNPDS